MCMQSIDWNTAPLGQVPDRELARQLGCGATTVRTQRQKRGIAPAISPTTTAKPTAPPVPPVPPGPSGRELNQRYQHAAIKLFAEGMTLVDAPNEKEAMTQIVASMERLLKRSMIAVSLYGSKADLCADIRSVLNWLEEIRDPSKAMERRFSATLLAS
jgi:hypothetical protein